MTPGVESRRPEVHLQVLSLVHVLDCFIIIRRQATDLVTIHREGDVAGCPLNLISVPVAADIDVARVLVILDFVVAVAIDGVG